MKKFLGRHKKPDDAAQPDQADASGYASSAHRKSVSTVGSRESVGDLGPMFEDKIHNDASLNLNPSIASTPTAAALSVLTDSTKISKSVFSQSMRTHSTNQSSYYSQNQKQAGSPAPYKNVEFGQRLQIVDIQEEMNEDDPHEAINEKLRVLADDLTFVMHQYDNSIVNLTSAVINSIDCFKRFVSFIESLRNLVSEAWNFNTYNNAHLRKIMKFYLNFYDNLLQDEVYIKLKLLLVRNFNDFALTLDTEARRSHSQMPPTMVKPQNFAIGVNKQALPNEHVLSKIIEKMASSPAKIKEQNGSFIAPIARGFSKQMNILCLYFGYPNPSDYHLKLTQSLQDLYDDIHVVVAKNYIEYAATKSMNPTLAGGFGPGASLDTPMPSATPAAQKFKLPFRVPTDVTQPPMSISLSVEYASKTSGTMGGYIYPKIDVQKQPKLESYANSKFAISCGHVCLGSGEDQTDYPHISAPSSVLIAMYKKALTQQYEKFTQQSSSDLTEAEVAYSSVLKQVDQMFPPKKIQVKGGKAKEYHYESRNLPVHRFGQIIWGERTLMSTKDSHERKLSDLAIVKVNKNLKCNQNYLGDDIAFNEFDPALMFDNLYVRRVIDLKRKNNDELNIAELDTEVPEPAKSNNHGGMPVFKYGSTTKYTQGTLNGVSLVYWLDGALQSSEFVINSVENNSAFAAGGDSGSWILAKLEDCDSVRDDKGLGVVGMLHSFDGEFRQFGLFTPMCEVLERLEDVTKIKWGVVGVPEKDTTSLPVDLSDTESESDVSSFSEDESTAELDDAANPPAPE